MSAVVDTEVMSIKTLDTVDKFTTESLVWPVVSCLQNTISQRLPYYTSCIHEWKATMAIILTEHDSSQSKQKTD